MAQFGRRDVSGHQSRASAIDSARESRVRADEMARFGRTPPRLQSPAWLGAAWLVASGCSHPTGAAVGAGERQPAPTQCARDEVREYFCDDLLPLLSARPAPEPYERCPAASDIRAGKFPAAGSLAEFDVEFTAYTRRRVQPGHSCCYGWCATVKPASVSSAAPADCRDSAGLREGFCMREPEGGTSAPAASPFEHCPSALAPPEVVAFAAPASARLDVAQTTQRRRETLLADCCYGWCSSTPVGTVLGAHPKTK